MKSENRWPCDTNVPGPLVDLGGPRWSSVILGCFELEQAFWEGYI